MTASVSISAIPVAAWACSPTAIERSNDHQQGGLTTGPLPRGRWITPCQPNPIAHLLGRSLRLCSGNLRERAVDGCASPIYSRRLAVCRPLRAFPLRACRPSCGYPLSHQQVVQAVVDGSHRHPNSLSKSSSLAGFKTSQKVLQGHGNHTQERGSLTQGSARND